MPPAEHLLRILRALADRRRFQVRTLAVRLRCAVNCGEAARLMVRMGLGRCGMATRPD
jgi:hypothetical protein